jgi:DNA phosphorothioation-associated putative methyltransferase
LSAEAFIQPARDGSSKAAIKRQRTALSRYELSRPLKLALADGLLSPNDSVFDYGCGRGDDLRNLQQRGINCSGWDPEHYPEGRRTRASIINLGYVINVIEDQAERKSTLQEAWSLAEKALIVAAQLNVHSKLRYRESFEDGFVTRRDTFQKYYEQRELGSWIDSVLGEVSVPAGPGVFYVFRCPEARESFLASKCRRVFATPRPRRVAILFEEHKVLLEPLMAFLAAKGRLPHESEFPLYEEIHSKVGGLNSAFRIIAQVTGAAAWDQIKRQRSQDLLIYLALARFGGRPTLSKLPFEIQLDVRAFFSTYSKASQLADDLLFSAGDLSKLNSACRASTVGKLTPSSLYVHTSAITLLDPILRVYEGCARAYIGSVEGANIVKLNHRYPQISYLAYPTFERDAHPALFASLIIPLRNFQIQYREYAASDNPPILHRKEAFVSSDHPFRNKFERLTKQEEKLGLFEETNTIGTKQGWTELLASRGLKMVGHKIIKTKSF